MRKQVPAVLTALYIRVEYFLTERQEIGTIMIAAVLMDTSTTFVAFEISNCCL